LSLEKNIWKWLEKVPDPEIPVLSILDLGVVRSVKVNDEEILIEITSTYSGCPATDVFIADIKSELEKHNLTNVKVQMKYSPAWTTDWITDKGRVKLKEFGIAPPVNEPDKSILFAKSFVVPCPKCDSDETHLVSQFGSTACKALYQCDSCQEPYDYFKCLR